MKPKMQLAPGNYISDAFRADMDKWLLEFFGYEDEKEHSPSPESPNVFDDVLPNVTFRKESKPKRIKGQKKSTRTQVQPDMETFSALLEGIEDSFYTMQLPNLNLSWLSNKDANALKKLGVFVPTDFKFEYSKTPFIPNGTKMPSICSSFFIPKKEDTKEKMHPRFIFAIKNLKLPHNVEKTVGIPYQFGLAVELHKNEDCTGEKQLLWLWCWIVARPDGSIRIPHELRPFTSPILHKKALPNKKGISGSRFSAVHGTAWCLPTIATAPEDKNQEDWEIMMKCSFRQLLMWWNGRESEWSVGVRRDGHRVTFNIDKRHTSAYFLDRDTVVNVDGKPKKIFHFVREHTRTNGAVVKEHVRGLREFDWKGYHCAITAPKLYGNVVTTIDINPVETDEKELPDGLISTFDMAKKLADSEDLLGSKL